MKKIHINCDLGEGGAYDSQLMPLISACNIACGGHAGDKYSMQRTVTCAIQNKVEIGAHPSYPDQENFGRKSLNISSFELKKSIRSQLKTFIGIVSAEGGKIVHIKPHGALYNDLAKNEKIAATFLECLLGFDEKWRLYAPPKSVISRLAKGKFEVFFEGFADRNYEADLSLVSRQKKHAVITKKELVFKQVYLMFSEGKISIENDKKIAFHADTFCLHSDTPNSVEILKYLDEKLRENNIQIFKK